MNLVQPQIHTIRRLSAGLGRAAIKTVDLVRLAPINDAQHHVFHREHEGKRLLTIVVMIGIIAYLVWHMG